ncbi:MAG: hypothetical protein A2Y62_18930 [Candidatus Fischerbacteria bacterium RBG_13_37_8]|uniref:Phosphoribosyltransferase domain-containing protein n=1 Tax=Candidatus Fischerbacteria bacterium RBG_13_37_8 TaxID=1817863 RepID=A0A1F5VKJ0_9BACT|nr:MAG: hypothetical protein A2Y62_18930 [Candidatus Fischerbacteria bacterium RBG_13_37_8]
MRTFLSAIGSVIFPVSCCLCDVYLNNQAICDRCWSKVLIIDEPYCIRCSKPFLNPLLLPYADSLLCEDCQEHPIYFKKCRSLAIYQDEFIHIIHKFKFANKPYLGNNLGERLAHLLLEEVDFQGIDLIIAVPLEKSRERKRGYNQSWLIAKYASKFLGIPVLRSVLGRHKGIPQSNLSMRERRKNIRGSFFIKRGAGIKGKRILLIDDVFTTGSTVNECSRILRHAGAREVLVATLARTL